MLNINLVSRLMFWSRDTLSNYESCGYLPSSAILLLDIGTSAKKAAELEVDHFSDETFVSKWGDGVRTAGLPDKHDL